MSAEFEAALEICGVLHAIDQNLDRIYLDMASRRERIATAAMIGLAASETENQGYASSKDMASQAVIMADALIAQLDAAENGRIDSRLIAAAPDLLAACETALAVLEQDWEGDEPSITGNMLRAAIAKAKSSS